MKQLYAPWRTPYSSRISHDTSHYETSDQCVFCYQFSQEKDEHYFIIKRYTSVALMLNIYPYNAGHLLVIPFTHHDALNSLSEACQQEIMAVICKAQAVLKQVLHAQGCNIGINIGKAAGAGIPAHIHAHVLPRWFGDTNYLPIFGQTKQISFDLTEIYTQLKPHF